eukprot:g438.t1
MFRFSASWGLVCAAFCLFVGLSGGINAPTGESYSLLSKRDREKVDRVEAWVAGFRPFSYAQTSTRSKNLKVKVFRSASQGMGYWVRKNNEVSVESGEEIFNVPLEACISFNATKGHPAIEHVFDELRKDEFEELSGLGEDMAIALFLMIEARRGEDSPFSGYVSFLPHNIDSPLMWAKEQLDEFLQASPAKQRVLSLQRLISRVFRTLGKTDDLVNYFPKLFYGMTRATVEEFTWAVATVWARAAFVDLSGNVQTRKGNVVEIYRPREDKASGHQNSLKEMKLLETLDIATYNRRLKAGQIKNERLIVPLLDTVNHDRTASSFYRYVPSQKAVKLWAGSPYGNGEEVKLNYGLFSNHDFFVKYGFVDPDNSFDFYRIPVRLHEEEADDGVKTALDEERNRTKQIQQQFINRHIVDPGQATIATDGRPLGETMLLLRVISMTMPLKPSRSAKVALAHAQRSLLESIDAGKLNTSKVFDDLQPFQNHSYMLLHDMCKATLQTYETLLEDDEKLLARLMDEENARGETRSGKRGLSSLIIGLQVRISDKRILKKCTEYVKVQLFGNDVNVVVVGEEGQSDGSV